MLIQLNLNGNPNLGSLCCANEEICLVPMSVADTDVRNIEQAMCVSVLKTTIGGMNILGSLAVMNSHGLLVSNLIEEEEIVFLEDLNLHVLEDRLNAVGNNILVNDRAALVHPHYTRRAMKEMADVLDVEVERGTVGGLKIVGSAAVVNDKGILCHPKADLDEIEFLENLFGLPAKIGTANFGSPLIGASVLANSKGAVTGVETTGVELNRIENALGLI